MGWRLSTARPRAVLTHSQHPAHLTVCLRASGVCPALHSPAVSEFSSSNTFFSYLTFSWQPHLLRLRKQANIFTAIIRGARICACWQLPRLPSLSRGQAPSYPCIVPLSRAVVSPTPTCAVILMKSGRGEPRGKTIFFFCTSLSKALHSNSSTESVFLSDPSALADVIAGFFLLEALGKPLRLLLESSHTAPSLHSGAYSTFPEVSCCFAWGSSISTVFLPPWLPTWNRLSRLPVWVLPLLILPEASLSSATGGIIKTTARLWVRSFLQVFLITRKLEPSVFTRQRKSHLWAPPTFSDPIPSSIPHPLSSSSSQLFLELSCVSPQSLAHSYLECSFCRYPRGYPRSAPSLSNPFSDRLLLTPPHLSSTHTLLCLLSLTYFLLYFIYIALHIYSLLSSLTKTEGAVSIFDDTVFPSSSYLA